MSPPTDFNWSVQACWDTLQRMLLPPFDQKLRTSSLLGPENYRNKETRVFFIKAPFRHCNIRAMANICHAGENTRGDLPHALWSRLQVDFLLLLTFLGKELWLSLRTTRLFWNVRHVRHF
ncbi:hypothetical protein U0070_004452 [Myodes glareolus]|uniref:Uncharacterized protein n=1 Tax=Myodes glareolus TaxID=447135 RepID=A0AAW0IS21_MYOGA